MAKRVDAEFSLRIGGLVPHLDDLGCQDKGIHPQVIHILNTPQLLQVIAQQDVFANAQMVDCRWHGVPVHQRVRAGGAAGYDLQPAADGLLYLPCPVGQLLHLVGRRLYGTIAGQIHADARQMDMGKIPLHMEAYLRHLVRIPKTLAQIA